MPRSLYSAYRPQKPAPTIRTVLGPRPVRRITHAGEKVSPAGLSTIVKTHIARAAFSV